MQRAKQFFACVTQVVSVPTNTMEFDATARADVTEPDAVHAPSGVQTIQHYEMIRRLGEGGMGAVYLARDTKLGRLVAIKLLIEITGASTARFLVEARATARCKLFELVTGAHSLAPLTYDKCEKVGVLRLPMPSVFDSRPDVGPLGTVIDRCLTKQKEEHIGSADELRAALEALLPGQKAFELGDGDCPFTGLSAFKKLTRDGFLVAIAMPLLS